MGAEDLIVEVVSRWHWDFYPDAELSELRTPDAWGMHGVCLGRLATLTLGDCVIRVEAANLPLIAAVPRRLMGEVTSVRKWTKAAELVIGRRLPKYLRGALKSLPRTVNGVAYHARKGSGEIVEWTHDFRGKRRPRLNINDDGWARLTRNGSTYSIDPDRGIVG